MSRLSKLAFLAAAICIIVFGVTRFLLNQFVPFLYIPIALFGIFVLVAVFFDRKLYLEFLTMRTTKHGMNMGMLILVMLALLAIINFLGVRHEASFDVTTNKINSLAPQSLKILEKLDSDLIARFFYQEGREAEMNKSRFREIIRKYQGASSKIKLDFVNVDKNPQLTEEYGVKTGAGVVFLDYKGRRGRIDAFTEQDVTKALVTVTKDSDKQVFFLQGHGEKDINDAKETNGLNAYKQLLEGNRFKVNTLNLVKDPKIPENADVIAIVGPKQQLLPDEIKILRDYLYRGGNLFLAIEQNQYSNINELAKLVGVEVDNGTYVVSVMNTMFGQAINPQATVANKLSTSHEITKVFGAEEFLVFKLPAVLTKAANVPAEITVDEIVNTEKSSLAFDDLSLRGQSKPGPFALVMTAKGKLKGVSETTSSVTDNTQKAPDTANEAGKDGKEFRAVVAGDADFLNNAYLYQNLNRDMGLNIIAYLAKEESDISITPKEMDGTNVRLSQMGIYGMVFGLAVPLPILLISSAVFFWYRRRNA